MYGCFVCCVCLEIGIIHITDRHGDIVDEIPMSTSAPILALQWDKDGEYLAILQDGNGVVPLWSLSSKRVVPLETNLRDPTFLSWSKTGPQLAIGTAKGSLLIYNKTRKQKIPVVGKHSKMITCGAWSKNGNKLVLGSDDRTLTISNENGDTLLHTEIKHVPLETHFTYNKSSTTYNSTNDDNVVSANLNGKSLLLYNIMDDKEDPMELTFATTDNGRTCKYGDVVGHHWFEEGLLLVGFSGGYLLSVSTNSHDLGEEKYACKFHDHNLTTFAYNPQLQRAATAGDDGVRIIDTRDFTECKMDFISSDDLENGRVISVNWTPDGQILTVGTSNGNVYNFLAKMAVLYAHYRTSVAYLSSLREIAVVDTVRRGRPIDITVRLEPSLLALGSQHLAAGMNNRVYYHRLQESAGNSDLSVPINEQEYVGIVKEVQLNANYAVILTDSKAIIHPIESSPTSQSQTRTFPSREEGSFARITCIALTDDFLYYGTEAGTVEVFFLAEWTLLSGAELRLNNAIRKLYPNSSGTRVVVVDSANQCFLFNPVTGGGTNQSITQFEQAPNIIVSVMWDHVEKNVIMFYDGKHIHSFIYVPVSIKGPMVIKLGPVVVSSAGEVNLTPDKIELIPGNIPILSSGGMLTCQTAAGSPASIVHPFFRDLEESSNSKSGTRGGRSSSDVDGGGRKDKKFLVNKFCQALALLKLKAAWEVALELDRRQFWLALSGKAMELMNIELACRVYRQLGDAGMVMALLECANIEDRNLLAGHISLLFCDYQRAQDLFLASSRPSAALDMRRDLLQWDQALALAQVLSAPQIPEICIRYGQQLEFREDSATALKMFEDALNAQDGDGANICPEPLVLLGMSGVARCNLRLGNIRQGIRLANELDDQQLFIDCGGILELSKQYSEAAAMYIKGQQNEKAALIYTKYLIKNDKGRISEAAVIMQKVDNDNLNSAFAKACVAAGRFEDALKAYERAKDVDKVGLFTFMFFCCPVCFTRFYAIQGYSHL
jgi:WD repeat-containing protein 19